MAGDKFSFTNTHWNAPSRIHSLYNVKDHNLTASILFAIIIVGTALRLFSIDLPGPQGDEVYMPYVALQMMQNDPIGQPKLEWFGRQLPLTISPYTGALPVYVYFLLLQFIHHPLLFRFVNIFWAILSMVLLFALARELWGSRRVGLIAAGLLAVMPTSVFYSRIGEFAVFVRVPISIAFLLLTYKLVNTGKQLYFYLACFILGLGVNTRLEMLWWLPAVVVWALPVMGVRTIWERLAHIHWPVLLKTALIGVGAFFIGAVPFSIYVIRDWGDLTHYFEANLITTGVGGVDNRLFWQNLWTRFLQIFALIDGTSLRETGLQALQNPINDLVFLAAVIYGISIVVRRILPRKQLQSLELLFWGTLVILIESTVTLSLFKPWHILMLLPIAILIITFLVDKVALRQKSVGLALLVVLLFSNVFVTVQDYSVLLKWRGWAGFSTGIYGLVDYLQQQGIQRVVAGDWGISRLIYFLSDGKVETREMVVYEPHPPIPDWFYPRGVAETKWSDGIWVFYSPPYTDLSTQEAFVHYLVTRGVQYDVVPLTDSHGTIFHIYHVKY